MRSDIRSKIFAAVLFLLLPAAASAAQPITGRWMTEDRKAIVTIAECGLRLCGRVSSILAPTPDGPPVDANNPNEALRNRPILGLTVLSGFTASGEVWRGSIYSPEEGKTYRSEIVRSGPSTLAVRGCVLVFCRSQTWTRAR